MAQNKVIVLASFLNVAGAQEAALRVTKGLCERNYDAETWFLYAEAKPAELATNTRILLDVTKPTPLQYLKIAIILYRELRRAKPYALVSFLPLANVLGQTIALLAGIRRRIASQRTPWHSYSKVMRHADSIVGSIGIYGKVIAVSQTVQQSYNRHPHLYQKRISVVYNGLHWVPSLLSKAEARKKFNLPEDRFVAVTLARLKPVKNYPFLVNVAEGLERVMIVAAGDGPQWDDIQNMIAATGTADRMRLLGAVAKSDVVDLFRAADCFILASALEGQSNALLEAMHNGTPVIVSDKPEQRETVIDSDGNLAGIALTLDNPRLWSQTLEGLALDKERCRTLSEAAKARAGDFTLDRQIEGFIAVIEGHEPPKVAALAKTSPASAEL